MTERERIRKDVDQPNVAVYDTTSTTRRAAHDGEDDYALARPKDLVRWGPVIAGLFAALATLATLTVLGLAIGLAAYDGDNQARNFGIGAGIWGAITALIAFAVGGWLAGRTAATRGTSSGILNGAMVWFVAIPMLLYLLGSGISGLAGTAVNAAAQAAGPVAGAAAGAAADNPATQATAAAGASNLGTAAQATAQALGEGTSPGQVESIADTASDTAWGTLLSLGLAAAAAIGGGYLGARGPSHDYRARA